MWVSLPGAMMAGDVDSLISTYRWPRILMVAQKGHFLAARK